MIAAIYPGEIYLLKILMIPTGIPTQIHRSSILITAFFLLLTMSPLIAFYINNMFIIKVSKYVYDVWVGFFLVTFLIFQLILMHFSNGTGMNMQYKSWFMHKQLGR